MITPKIYVHGSYIGNTGYNNHTRDFFRQVSKHTQLKVRNFTVGASWSGNSSTPHNGESYLNDTDKSILYKQRLWVSDGKMEDFTIYPQDEKEFFPDFNIVLNETNYHLFYENYSGPKIAYNVWESTLQPETFFNKLIQKIVSKYSNDELLIQISRREITLFSYPPPGSNCIVIDR